MQAIKTTERGFDVEFCDSTDVIFIYSGEFKYAVPFTYEGRVEDGECSSTIELNELMTLTAYGNENKDFPSDLLYQLKLDIQDVLDSVKEILDEQMVKDHGDQETESALNDAHYRSIKGF